MYEPFAKNSITERVQFTGIASESDQALETWESVSAHAASQPPAHPEPGSAQPDLDGRSQRPRLHAIR